MRNANAPKAHYWQAGISREQGPCFEAMPGVAMKSNAYNSWVGYNSKHSHYSHRPVRRHGSVPQRKR